MKFKDEDTAVLAQASNRVDALLKGESPEAMDVTSYCTPEEAKLAGAINTLIQSFLHLDNYKVSMTNGVHDKCPPDIKTQPDFPSEMIHPRMMEVIVRANNDARSDNLKDMVCQMAIKERSFNEAMDDLIKSRKEIEKRCAAYDIETFVENE